MTFTIRGDYSRVPEARLARIVAAGERSVQALPGLNVEFTDSRTGAIRFDDAVLMSEIPVRVLADLLLVAPTFVAFGIALGRMGE